MPELRLHKRDGMCHLKLCAVGESNPSVFDRANSIMVSALSCSSDGQPGAAASAGLRHGDIIRVIDGNDVAGVPLVQVAAYFARQPGPFRVEVERSDGVSGAKRQLDTSALQRSGGSSGTDGGNSHSVAHKQRRLGNAVERSVASSNGGSSSVCGIGMNATQVAEELEVQRRLQTQEQQQQSQQMMLLKLLLRRQQQQQLHQQFDIGVLGSHDSPTATAVSVPPTAAAAAGRMGAMNVLPPGFMHARTNVTAHNGTAAVSPGGTASMGGAGAVPAAFANHALLMRPHGSQPPSNPHSPPQPQPQPALSPDSSQSVRRTWGVVHYTDRTCFLGELHDGDEHTGCLVDTTGDVQMTKFADGKSYEIRPQDEGYSYAESAARRAYKGCRPGSDVPVIDFDKIGIKSGELDQVYCVCRQKSYGYMLGCASCDGWFHGRCMDIREAEVQDNHDFICPNCNAQNPGHPMLITVKRKGHRNEQRTFMNRGRG